MLPAPASACDIRSQFCLGQGCLGPEHFIRRPVSLMLTQPLLGTCLLVIDALHIYILGPFYRVGIDDDSVLDIDESAGDSRYLVGIFGSTALLDPHLADIKQLACPGVTLHETLVTGQCSDYNELHITLIKLFRRSNDFQSYAVCHDKSLLLLFLALFVLFNNLVNTACKEEHLLRDLVMLAIQDLTEAANCLLERQIFTLHTCELFCYAERL